MFRKNQNIDKHGINFRTVSLWWHHLQCRSNTRETRTLSLSWLQKGTWCQFCDHRFFKEKQFTLHSGSPQAFQHQSESGNTMTKEFCPRCGSTVFGSNSGRPGIKSVYIGSFENASFVEPNFNVWTCRQLPYTLIDESLNNYPKGPQ